MQFHHPEVLYALFFLIIPVLVHLFQLRKFRREDFTNVKFLKRVTQQTRKSSKLKKWLVLATRLFLLASIIFAFSQPFIPDETIEYGTIETVIYLDNSYSMQANGQQGRLLDRSIQELLENLPDNQKFTLITNTEEFPELTKQDLQELEYTGIHQDFKTIALKAESLFSRDSAAQKKLLLISDFQKGFTLPEDLELKNTNIYALPLKPERFENIRLDSAFITREASGDQILNIEISASQDFTNNTAVSLYNGDKLIGKTGVDFSENKKQQLDFPISEEELLSGSIQIEDNDLAFDNTLYFSINKIEPINISSINNADDAFLKRIFTTPEFNYTSFTDTEINFNALASSKVIILNEVSEISNSLLNTFQQKKLENTVFILIPSIEDIGSNYRLFVRELGVTGFQNQQQQEKRISGISFQHPLYNGVFEDEIANFEYPKTQISYKISGSGPSILSFQDQEPFLIGIGGNYFFSSALNSQNSNFIRSPLVVPTFYNMGISALQPTPLYYTLGETNKITVPVSTGNDEILQLTSKTANFIPQQQRFSNKVEMITDEFPQKPGNFGILQNERTIMGISYNVNRKESEQVYQDLENIKNIEILNDIPQFISSGGYKKDVDTLWKWFVTFALLFLIMETLLLKYFK
ncbi:BatA domain-containing protein [Gillisia limnaea]|uniref:Double-transmembrane region domain protein n=1 Tax=Gillisia limnaea (strain DSM 15749 / LMG 21470 / R-8282) TaxID=865937 RepID=H2BWX9_GILLR|nr:BatA domain-containing protein [Gillisia limnaea]EHQ04152.1 double-transmembrane region domain protein [Gillisia limnaea DSM 15749]